MGILAFIQSLLYLVIWLWICASAGAGTPFQVEFSPDLIQSRYDPVKQRDPFSKSGTVAKDTIDAKPAPTPTYAFHLEGILYQPRDPSAIVDGTLLSLNKTVALNTGSGKVQVKAVEITRDHVVLEVGGRTIELRVNMQDSVTPPP